MLSCHSNEGLHCNVLPRFGPQGARLMALTSCAPIEAVTQVEKKASLFVPGVGVGRTNCHTQARPDHAATCWWG